MGVSTIELHACPHFIVLYDGMAKVVTLTRTPTPFAALSDVDPCLTKVNMSLVNLPRAECAILIDTRNGPVRNDPGFEDVFAPHRKRILEGFGRAAVLVRTATGRLQAQRYTRDDRLEEVRVFDNEKAALAHIVRKKSP